MDWSKAKNILIIAFVITNIFLFFNIKQNIDQHNYFYKVDNERIEDVTNILDEKSIVVNTDVPKQVPRLAVLTLKYETYKGKEVADKILGQYETKDGEFIKDNEKVKIDLNNKLIIYERRPQIFSIENLTEEKAKEIADNFIEKYGFYNRDIKQWNVLQKERGQYEIIYKQIYKDMIIRDSEMKVLVNNTGVLRLERRWLQIEGIKDHEKRVIPATKALLIAIDKINKEDNGAIITDITLGYSLDISKFNSLANQEWYNMELGDASPYWIICLENKECIYIEAYE